MSSMTNKRVDTPRSNHLLKPDVSTRFENQQPTRIRGSTASSRHKPAAVTIGRPNPGLVRGNAFSEMKAHRVDTSKLPRKITGTHNLVLRRRPHVSFHFLDTQRLENTKLAYLLNDAAVTNI